jgi:hypothetical protein
MLYSLLFAQCCTRACFKIHFRRNSERKCGNRHGEQAAHFYHYPAAAGRVVFLHGLQLLSWVDFFKQRKPQKGGLGVATPTRFPQDKIER